ncbi:hypothetical protein HK097_003537 [Rhizophlyctis rosea]|uniref:Cytochrome c oxidase polypeptide VIIA n=1 Tax=Rhizophlyctis rosea TaxID=64517 RepID=A0AAD5SFH0_9FUNG|nr:hypothetical protein HK097_003537 [Rhizophlyctis rosea]
MHAASAVAPIAGRFRRRVLFDIVGSLSLGTAAAYYFWYSHHVPKMAAYKAYDEKVRAEIQAEYGEWAKNREGGQPW